MSRHKLYFRPPALLLGEAQTHNWRVKTTDHHYSSLSHYPSSETWRSPVARWRMSKIRKTGVWISQWEKLKVDGGLKNGPETVQKNQLAGASGHPGLLGTYPSDTLKIKCRRQNGPNVYVISLIKGATKETPQTSPDGEPMLSKPRGPELVSGNLIQEGLRLISRLVWLLHTDK
ncbi:unnamed protein product [Calicophoron daubneyi]|uniref:Uncharacterized protein n=1 Tax=Calicophoron daubneyi TaxID=300641 RepID=A0AAV2TM60_CALDB